MSALTVAARGGAYPVEIGPGLLNQLGALLRAAGVGGRIALITDDNVARFWGEAAHQALRAAQYDVTTLVVKPGEAAKTMSEAERVCGGLIEAGLGRGDCVLALGGGVVGDLAGFVAATYHRGVGFVQTPTTLLAQVDSSVGGKVAVDHVLGKNLIGAFHPPRLVVADTDTLATLPARELWSGLAEVVKAALIADVGLLEMLEQNLPALGAGEATPEVLARAVRGAVQIKADIVAADEFEHSVRAHLNFGHTFAHAVEATTGFSRLTHGEAVVIGMGVAVAMSERKGALPREEAARARALLARFPAAPAWPRPSRDQLVAALRRDKKASANAIRYVVLDGLGAAQLVTLSEDDLAFGVDLVLGQ